MAGLADFFSRHPVSAAFIDEHAGACLGRGVSRVVYEMRLHKKHVIKIEAPGGGFQNVAEWLSWDCAQYMGEASKWLAPCVAISPCGSVLIQKRTSHCPIDRLPGLLPAWMIDTKAVNWGLHEGRPVLHDYGRTLIWNALAEPATKPFDWTSPGV